MGAADSVNALERLVAERLGSSSFMDGRLGVVLDGRLSPYDLVPATRVIRWMGAAVLRGQLNVVPPFVRNARRAFLVARDPRRFRRLSVRPRQPADLNIPLASDNPLRRRTKRAYTAMTFPSSANSISTADRCRSMSSLICVMMRRRQFRACRYSSKVRKSR